MKRLIILFILIIITQSGFAFNFNGELSVYSSGIIDGSDFLKNSASVFLKAGETVGKGEVKTDVEVFYSSIDKKETSLLLRELFYRRSFEFENKLINEFEIKAGFIKYTWGKSDELRILDVINPQYLNFVTFDKIEDRKIGRFSFAFAIGMGDSTKIETIVMPMLQKSILDYVPIMPKAMRDIYLVEQSGMLKIDKTIPDNDEFKNTSVGIRFKDNRFGIDYDLYYYHGNYNQPTYFWDSSTNVSEAYPTLDMLGIDFEKAIGKVVLRGELVYFFNGKYFSSRQSNLSNSIATDGRGVFEKKYMQFVIGFDIRNFIFKDFYINLQYAHNNIFDYDADILQDKSENTITAKLEYSFAKDHFKIGLNSAFFIERGFQLNPEIYIKLDDGANLFLGANIFKTENDDYLLGTYDKMDFAYMKFAVNF